MRGIELSPSGRCREKVSTFLLTHYIVDFKNFLKAISDENRPFYPF
ncbi:hypothetical protein HMPREF0322_04706 [Desulfitobacterium hafniense DP7]|uniref:Uncharacterized protein n=1 Tax=Desulfitobacterium hafniense DP7 TaxID=537010 RepID=G9XUP7_DESHA|nr:hypothetical protein HMPREF0322_04706 [Desulfitobacterium hafniense DP7]